MINTISWILSSLPNREARFRALYRSSEPDTVPSVPPQSWPMMSFQSSRRPAAPTLHSGRDLACLKALWLAFTPPRDPTDHPSTCWWNVDQLHPQKAVSGRTAPGKNKNNITTHNQHERPRKETQTPALLRPRHLFLQPALMPMLTNRPMSDGHASGQALGPRLLRRPACTPEYTPDGPSAAWQHCGGRSCVG